MSTRSVGRGLCLRASVRERTRVHRIVVRGQSVQRAIDCDRAQIRADGAEKRNIHFFYRETFPVRSFFYFFYKRRQKCSALGLRNTRVATKTARSN